MGIKQILKDILGGIMLVSFVGCGGSPSISVLPSTDTFQQQGNEITAKMDILWVIDNSGSMGPYQAELQARFDSFITNFVGKNYDFRMAVTATDGHYTKTIGPSGYEDATFSNCSRTVTLSSKFLDGNFTDGATGYPIIDSNDATIDFSLTPLISDPDETDDIETIFSANIGQGTCGAGAEAGLESLQVALENPFNISTYGFPRADAHLAVIVVTDEEDVTIDGKSVAEYKTFLDSVASESHGFSFHTIAVLEGEMENVVTPSPCFVGGTSILHAAASESLRYPALSALSDGIVASICSPFDETLQDIAQKIIEKTVEFSLSSVPADPNALVVSIKNIGSSVFVDIPQNVDNGWTYNALANSIVFHGTAIPAQGAQISIFYDPDGL